jgi:hypothetical protein
MQLNQLLRVAKPGSLDTFQEREHFACGVEAEFSFARFEAAQQ